jgi:hypothetical protein
MSKYMRLDDKNRTRVRIGSLAWFWYRMVLSRPAFINWCMDCHKPIDSFDGVNTNLCTCAFELDMKGTK